VGVQYLEMLVFKMDKEVL
jgi:hypothetical protein